MSTFFSDGSKNMPRGRGRPRQFDDEQALDLALRLFWRHGYEGTPISTLAQAMALTVASVYNAFGNKESLFMKAVDHYDRYSASLYEEAFAQHLPGRSAGDSDGRGRTCFGRRHTGRLPDDLGALATSPESEAVRQAMAKLRRQAEAEVAPRGSSSSRRRVNCHRAGMQKRWQAM